ncbi:hypothetical protein PN462_09485 [Spirulina sp. CS-785/01]|uniref:hypothetical protein n=1 Tax=Spirulina sp. CS-785/01 TaxID=3021716 RepID=UPI002330D905|nr:hypothetical protein [Spirulina sp. CS-785/01]MDB9313330.1 hypothetical protein [Spirulina sp. CS-785/01]
MAKEQPRYKVDETVGFIHKFKRCGKIVYVDERRRGNGYKVNTGKDKIYAYEKDIILISADTPICTDTVMQKIDKVGESFPAYTESVKDQLIEFFNQQSKAARAFGDWVSKAYDKALRSFFKEVTVAQKKEINIINIIVVNYNYQLEFPESEVSDQENKESETNDKIKIDIKTLKSQLQKTKELTSQAIKILKAGKPVKKSQTRGIRTQSKQNSKRSFLEILKSIVFLIIKLIFWLFCYALLFDFLRDYPDYFYGTGSLFEEWTLFLFLVLLWVVSLISPRLVISFNRYPERVNVSKIYITLASIWFGAVCAVSSGITGLNSISIAIICGSILRFLAIMIYPEGTVFDESLDNNLVIKERWCIGLRFLLASITVAIVLTILSFISPNLSSSSSFPESL